MTRKNVWLNNDGLLVGYGSRSSTSAFAGTVRTTGNEEVITMILDHSDMPTTDNTQFYNATDTEPFQKACKIPANAIITEAKLVVHEVFACAGGNPTMTIGLMASDGTVIDADGIYAGLTEASSQLVANWVLDGDAATYGGALVNGTASIGASDGYIYAAGVTTAPASTTTTWDTGKATLTVKYIRQIPDDEPTAPHSTTTKLT